MGPVWWLRKGKFRMVEGLSPGLQAGWYRESMSRELGAPAGGRINPRGVVPVTQVELDAARMSWLDAMGQTINDDVVCGFVEVPNPNQWFDGGSW